MKRLVCNDEGQVPKELAVSWNHASHFSDRKEFLHEKILHPLSAHKGRQTIHESVCHKSPHTPGRFQVSVCANSFRRGTLCRLCPFPSNPAKKPLPLVNMRIVFA